MAGIPVDRARWRNTLTYQVDPRVSVGVEWNPLDDDLGLLANWRVLDETATRPELMVGTSSDRIGTPSGRAYFATLSKDLGSWLDLPVAPYVGASYGEFDEEVVAIGGLRVRYGDRWSSGHLWDGHNLHHILDHTIDDRWRIGLLVAEQDGDYYAGLRIGVSF